MAEAQGIKNVKVIPDGSGEFTRVGMLVAMTTLALVCALGGMLPLSTMAL